MERREIRDAVLYPDGNGWAPPLTQFYDPYIHGITQGILGTWMSCPEKARLTLVEGITTAGSKYPLDFGNIFHENLDRVYTQFRDGNVTAQMVPDVSRAILLSQENELVRQMVVGNTETVGRITEIEYAFATCGVMLNHYWRQWADDFSGKVWVELEQEFQVPIYVPYLGGNVQLRGKIDGIFRTPDGGLWLMDHKTKSTIDDTVMVSRLSFDLQMGLYLYAASKVHGERCRGFVYNLVRRPALRQKQNEPLNDFVFRIDVDVNARADTYFSRQQVQFFPDELDRFESELTQIVTGFVRWYEGNAPHFRNSTSCSQKGYTCEMLDICAGCDTFRYSKKKRVFPELGKDLLVIKEE